MPLKTLSFNSGIFKNNIKRFWLITFSYTFFMFLYVMSYINRITERMNRASDIEVLSDLGNIILYSNEGMVVFLGFYPLVAALAVFSYMHFQKNTAMIHSLPVTRSTLFVTNYLSGLFIAGVPLVFNSIILIIFETVSGIPNLSYAWIWFGINLVLTFLLYNFAVFVGMFTGHLAAQAIFFYIFNFLAPFLEAVIKSIFNDLLFGYVSYTASRTFEAWSPLYYLESFYKGFRNDNGNIAVIVGYLIAAIVFVVAGYYLYKIRHMEVATDVISFSFVKPVFKYSVAFCSAALMGSIIVLIFDLYHNLEAYIVSYLIGSFIGYFSAEMLMRKTFKVFKAYKGYIVFALILSLFLCSINYDLFGYERKVPQYSEIEILGLNTYMDNTMRIALKPEEYDPDLHRYLFSARDYYGKYEPPKVLSEEHIKELRETIPGISDNYEVITKVREIHSYIVENEKLFRENEKLYKESYWGPTAEQKPDLFKYRNLYFLYKLENGSFIERKYDLVTYQDNTELDRLLREYLSFPGVRESYMPILKKNAEDIHRIYVSFETRDGHYQDFEITKNIQDFLDVYKQELLTEDPLKALYGTSEPYEYDINIHIEFKSELLNITTSHYDKLYSHFENTIKYLVEKGVFKLEDLMRYDDDTEKVPAAKAM